MGEVSVILRGLLYERSQIQKFEKHWLIVTLFWWNESMLWGSIPSPMVLVCHYKNRVPVHLGMEVPLLTAPLLHMLKTKFRGHLLSSLHSHPISSFPHQSLGYHNISLASEGNTDTSNFTLSLLRCKIRSHYAPRGFTNLLVIQN